MDNNNITQENTEVEINSEKPEEKEKPALPPHKEYAKRMLNFNEKYIMTLCAAGVAIAAGLALIMYYKFIAGAAVAALGVIIYTKFVDLDLYNQLGFEYKTYTEGLKLTLCRARYGDVLWIPSKLFYFDVTRIEDKAFSNKYNEELRCVFLPKSLRSIGKDVFDDCPALTDIFFEGSEAEWERIEKETDLSSFSITFDAKYPPVKKNNKAKAKAKKKKK